MSERESQSTPEHLNNTDELERIAESLNKRTERAAKRTEDKDKQVEAARAEIDRQSEELPAFEEKPAAPKPMPHRLDKAAAYHQTMASLRRQLKPASRAFSQIIHTPIVESASEVVGKTILRPSVTLGATVTALIFGLSLYVTAKHYGFALRGSELIIALLIGGLIGAALEGAVKLFRHPKI